MCASTLEDTLDRAVVVLRLDAATEDRMLALHAAISARCGIDIVDFQPHVTLAAYEDAPLAPLVAWIAEQSGRHAPFDVRFSSFAFFPASEKAVPQTVLFLAPAAAPALTTLYYEVHQRLDEYAGSLGWLYSMRYGHPAMHATVHLLPRPVALLAADYMLRAYQEIVGTAVALEVHRWPMRLLARFPLAGGAAP